MKLAKVRSARNYDRRAASREVATDCSAIRDGETLRPTIQSAKDECDLNVMVRRFGVTGVIMGIKPPPPIEEFGEIFDFQSAMNVLRAAQESFDSLSANVRSRFNNDAAKFADFCCARDEKGVLRNLDEMRKLGLAIPEVVPVPEKVLTVKIAGGRLDEPEDSPKGKK